ncbi:redox-regulated molecular chaperone Hsp33, partial [Providencia huaxiensis]
MAKQDLLHRFLFEQHSVRGEMISVDDTFERILENHD